MTTQQLTQLPVLMSLPTVAKYLDRGRDLIYFEWQDGRMPPPVTYKGYGRVKRRAQWLTSHLEHWAKHGCPRVEVWRELWKTEAGKYPVGECDDV